MYIPCFPIWRVALYLPKNDIFISPDSVLILYAVWLQNLLPNGCCNTSENAVESVSIFPLEEICTPSRSFSHNIVRKILRPREEKSD